MHSFYCSFFFSSVLLDHKNNFQLRCFIFCRVDGLRKKSNFFASLVTAFKKPSDPSKLCSNATFTVFNLTPSSLQLSLDVQTDRRRKKRKGNANRVDTYTCNVRKFPTNINPDSAEFEVCSTLEFKYGNLSGLI